MFFFQSGILSFQSLQYDLCLNLNRESSKPALLRSNQSTLPRCESVFASNWHRFFIQAQNLLVSKRANTDQKSQLLQTFWFVNLANCRVFARMREVSKEAGQVRCFGIKLENYESLGAVNPNMKVTDQQQISGGCAPPGEAGWGGGGRLAGAWGSLD